MLKDSIVCVICETEIESGNSYLIHLENYEFKGVNPHKIVPICEDCKIYKAVPFGGYCSLTSWGRDSWDLQDDKFDCLCKESIEDIIKDSEE